MDCGFAVILGCVTLASGPLALAAMEPEEIYARVQPAVMTLAVENAGGESFLGNAFLMFEPDLALTAWHVIQDAR